MNMKKTIYTLAQHKSNLRNIQGTFAIEGMSIGKSTRANLDRIASGKTSYEQVCRNCGRNMKSEGLYGKTHRR